MTFWIETSYFGVYLSGCQRLQAVQIWFPYLSKTWSTTFTCPGWGGIVWFSQCSIPCTQCPLWQLKGWQILQSVLAITVDAVTMYVQKINTVSAIHNLKHAPNFTGTKRKQTVNTYVLLWWHDLGGHLPVFQRLKRFSLWIVQVQKHPHGNAHTSLILSEGSHLY